MTDSVLAPSPDAPAAPVVDERCIVRRRDGIHADPGMLGAPLVAAIDNLLRSGHYLANVDYPVLLKALFDCGPELPRGAGGEPRLRFAADIVPFADSRRALYRSAKISGGQAEYYFEPVYLPGEDGDALPARLDLDEFIADMWLKGIRFGIDIGAVAAAIEFGQAGRVVVARRLDPAPGQDARVIEVSDDLHRSDAPRQLANGKLDLMSFQNRFPQIQPGVRLLKKVPRAAGTPGFELSGIALEPEAPKDLDLAAWSGPGTAVERTGEGEFLVSKQAGFLSVDARSSQVSVGDKIVSHDGVSAKTTGNLQLAGDFEEFGEVQEKRVIEGEGITVHADVYGNIVSRGGLVLLNRNLVGGSAHNKQGDIHVKGVASNAVIQSSCGEVVLQRAENCIVSGTRVRIEQAINCDVIGDEVEVGHAEGCALAAHRLEVGRALPRRQGEMLLYALYQDCAGIDAVLDQVGARLAQLGELAARRKAELDALVRQPAVTRYMQLAARVRKGELTLTPEQVPQFQKMAQAVAPTLKAVATLSGEVKAAEAELQSGQALVAQLEQQRGAAGGEATVSVRDVQGEIRVYARPYTPDGTSTYDLPPREIKARLRGSDAVTALLFAGSSGAFVWSSGAG